MNLKGQDVTYFYKKKAVDMKEKLMSLVSNETVYGIPVLSFFRGMSF